MPDPAKRKRPAHLERYLKTKDSVNVRLLEAETYRLKGELPKAISLLKAQRELSPFNSLIANSLAETTIQAGHYNDAREICEGLVQEPCRLGPGSFPQRPQRTGSEMVSRSQSLLRDRCKTGPRQQGHRLLPGLCQRPAGGRQQYFAQGTHRDGGLLGTMNHTQCITNRQPIMVDLYGRGRRPLLTNFANLRRSDS